MRNKRLSLKLRKMTQMDQMARKAATKNPSLWDKVRKVDQANLKKMKEIIKKFGWPTISLVGKRGSNAAWLLAQHADSNLKFQILCLQLMKQAVMKNDVSKANIAYLTDRVLVNSGKPQVFGTQFHTTRTGELTPRPIRGITHLNKRRKEIGLESFTNYKAKLKRRQNNGNPKERRDRPVHRG